MEIKILYFIASLPEQDSPDVSLNKPTVVQLPPPPKPKFVHLLVYLFL